jgi:hypothetical protein
MQQLLIEPGYETNGERSGSDGLWIVVALLQRSGPPSLTHSCNGGRKVSPFPFLFWGFCLAGAFLRWQGSFGGAGEQRVGFSFLVF